MDTEIIENQSAFITFKELSRTQDILKKELMQSQKEMREQVEKRMDKADTKMEKLEDKVAGVDDKVDHLRDLVLPLLKATEATAENTKQIAVSMNEFTKEQRKTNGIFHEKINVQAVAIEGLKHIAGGVVEKKKYNAGIVVAVITAIGGIIVVIIQLAPTIAPLLFDK